MEIETDKATVEVPAERSGVVKSINVKDGDTVKVGTVIFTFEDENQVDSKQKEEVKNDEKAPSPEIKESEHLFFTL